MSAEGLARQVMPATPTSGYATTAKKTKKGKSMLEKMRSLYETLRDYKDPKGRQLSLIFLRLPNMKEFPDYYEVIKRPIDFERIGAKLKQVSIFFHVGDQRQVLKNEFEHSLAYISWVDRLLRHF
jgi:hypothetical protein